MANNNNKRNPRNTDSFLFKSLTRLLSGPLTRFQKQNPRQLKRWQLDKYKFRTVNDKIKNFFKSIFCVL